MGMALLSNARYTAETMGTPHRIAAVGAFML
jgi:hypothetical protein